MTYIAHGTDPNQIGHGSNIDTGDTPGSTGGKFIGFGEDGTSANANRAHWFLSQNIDHVYQEVHRDIAIPKRYDRTSAGDTSFQFPNTDSEEIWTGDDTYPGSAGTSDAEGMQMLFNILDSNYNELTDGEDNEIRVKLVRESTGVTDIYQGEFQDQPIIYFISVDPITGATVDDPYTIPAATNYKIICGIKSTVAEMPADALIRFKAQSSSEVEAGTFFQDGSRPMTGTFDLDDQGMTDEYLSGALRLSETGETALYQPVDALIYPSLVGAVNAGTRANEFMQGDRCLDRTGTFDSATAPDVDHPAITVTVGGQILQFDAATVTASSGDGQYFLYVTPAGVLTFAKHAGWSAAPAGSVPLWTAELDTGSWGGVLDLRWKGTAGKHDVIYVGSGVGTDFTSLDDLYEWIQITAGDVEEFNTTYEIVVVGTVTLSSTFSLPKGWTLRGLSTLGSSLANAADSVITTTTDFAVGTHLIDAAEYSVVKDLTLTWGNTLANQSSGYAALYINYGCVVENVLFDDVSYRFDNGISTYPTAVSMPGPRIKGCLFNEFVAAGIVAAGYARVQVEGCTFYTNNTPAYHIDFESANDTGDKTGPAHTIRNCYFSGRPTLANIRVGGPNVLIDSCHGSLATGADKPFLEIMSGGTTQDRAGATVRNCLIESGFSFVHCTINDDGVELSLNIEGCVCTALEDMAVNLAGVLASTSRIVVDSNSFGGDGTSETAIQIKTSNVRVSNNIFTSWVLYCVYVVTTAEQQNLWIADNLFASSCTKTVTVDSETDVQASAIMLSSTDFKMNNVSITGNVFRTLSGSAIRGECLSDSVVVSGNLFDAVQGRYMIDNGGSIEAGKYAVLAVTNTSDWTISNNRFINCGGEYSIPTAKATMSAHAIYISTAGGSPAVITGNDFGDSTSSGVNTTTDIWYNIGVYDDDTAVVCSGNNFYANIGTYRPHLKFAHIGIGGSNVTISGCTFRLLGAASPDMFTGGSVSCVTGTGVLVASGCYSYGSFATNNTDNVWNISSGAGVVMGCYFESGAVNGVNLSMSSSGFVAGNMFKSTGTVSTNSHPTSDTYEELAGLTGTETRNPRGEFNIEV